MWKTVLRNLETSTAFMWYCIIRGRGRFWSTVGRSFESRLHSVMRCRAVCLAFSGQVQSGVGAFFSFYGGMSESSRGLLGVVSGSDLLLSLFWCSHFYQGHALTSFVSYTNFHFMWKFIYIFILYEKCNQNWVTSQGSQGHEYGD